MRHLILGIALVLTFSLKAQKRFSLSVNNSVGLLQVEKRWFVFPEEEQEYHPRYGLGLSGTVRLFDTDLELGIGLLHSWSSIRFFVGGMPLFPHPREGFPRIPINNNHLESRLFLQHPFIKEAKVKIAGSLGLCIAQPTFPQQAEDINEGSSRSINSEVDMRLDYRLHLINRRPSWALISGLSSDFFFSDNLALNIAATYQIGLRNAITYDYYGELLRATQTVPIREGHGLFFSNTGVFLDIGLKWYW